MRKLACPMVVALACASTFAQDATLTAYPESQSAKAVEGGVQSDSVCFYGGDFDHRNGLSSERNTSIADSWVFDDFEWAGGMVDTAFGDFLDTGIGMPSGGDLVVYAGMSEGNFGTLVGGARDVNDFTWVPRGIIDPSMVRLTLHLNARAFYLPAGSYHIGLRAVGTGQGQAFVATTSGNGSVGAPVGNGNSYFQSYYFGYPVPTACQNIVGNYDWDFTLGLECGGEGYTLEVRGDCPGTIQIEWNRARAGARQAIIYSTGLGNAPIPGPCGNIPSGLASVTLQLPTFSTIGGEGIVTGHLSAPACGQFIQLVTYKRGPCMTSNVAQLP